jgi:hypothetical protein
MASISGWSGWMLAMPGCTTKSQCGRCKQSPGGRKLQGKRGKEEYWVPTKLQPVHATGHNLWMTIGAMTWSGMYSNGIENGWLLKVPIVPNDDYRRRKDLTLPFIAEEERLVNLLPNTEVHVVEGAAHASTCGSGMDIMAAILRTRFSELLQNP